MTGLHVAVQEALESTVTAGMTPADILTTSCGAPGTADGVTRFASSALAGVAWTAVSPSMANGHGDTRQAPRPFPEARDAGVFSLRGLYCAAAMRAGGRWQLRPFPDPGTSNLEDEAMRRFLVLGGTSLLALFGAIQLVPVDRTNPPVEEEVPVPPEVRDVLVRACYDCHSNETVWPWYAHVAPVSWLVARDVHEGREALNFSTWNRLTTREQVEALRESWEEVEEGEMPLWFYLPTHPEARLTDRDRALLRAWALGAGQR